MKIYQIDASSGDMEIRQYVQAHNIVEAIEIFEKQHNNWTIYIEEIKVVARNIIKKEN